MTAHPQGITGSWKADMVLDWHAIDSQWIPGFRLSRIVQKLADYPPRIWYTRSCGARTALRCLGSAFWAVFIRGQT